MPDKSLFRGEWFPYYYDRFEGSERVALMSLAEEGAYHRAIRIAWKYGSVPADPKHLAAMIQKRCIPKIASAVLTMFEPMPGNPDRMIHPTVEEIRAEQHQKYLNHVKGGKASARTRSKQSPLSITSTEVSNAQTIVEQNSNRIKNKIEIQIQNPEGFKRLIETVASEFPKADKRIVELGILYTMLQRNGPTDPINSTKYFHPQIRKIVQEAKCLSETGIESLLAIRRDQFWKQQGK
jgi:hypothetical protein